MKDVNIGDLVMIKSIFCDDEFENPIIVLDIVSGWSAYEGCYEIFFISNKGLYDAVVIDTVYDVVTVVASIGEAK